MRVSTRCRTIDELIAAFATLVDETSLVVLTDQQRTIGSRQPFVVELADGTFVMRGEAEVIESTPPPRGRLRLRFLALDAGGREVHQQMLDRKKGTTRSLPRSPTQPLVRIPEVTTTRPDPTPPPVPPVKPAPAVPPAPFARPVPSPTPTTRSAAAVSVPMIPPRKLPTPPPSVPAVPSLPSVPRVKPPASLPPFEEVPDLDTTVDNTFTPPVVPTPSAPPVVPAAPVPAPPPAPAASSIEAAVAEASERARPASPPPHEERTPGSPYILPANPFGEVAPESLEAFVECTLYEETGQFSFGDGGIVNDLAPSIDDDPSIDPPIDPPTTPAFPRYTADPPAPLVSLPPVAAPPPPVMVAPVAPAPLAAPADTWPLFDAPAPGALDLDAGIARKPPWKWIGLGVVALAAIVIIVVSVAGGGGEKGAAAGSGSVAAKDPAKRAVDAGVAASPPIDAGAIAVTHADAATADAGTPVAAGPDASVAPVPANECHLRLTVDPDGAHIKLDGLKIGDAPIDAAIPCRPAHLTIVRSHYAIVDKKLKPAPGEPIVMDVKLVRPEVRLSITSTPPGAMIKVDGHSLGKAPTSTVVKGYQTVLIEATLKGYDAWSKQVTPEKAAKKVVIPLKRSRHR